MAEKFAQDCLKAHNEYRRKHGAHPLTLSAKVFLHNLRIKMLLLILYLLKRFVNIRKAGPKHWLIVIAGAMVNGVWRIVIVTPMDTVRIVQAL